MNYDRLDDEGEDPRKLTPEQKSRDRQPLWEVGWMGNAGFIPQIENQCSRK